MVDTRICSFCGRAIEPGTGKMVVHKDATIFYFCDTKCQNNQNLGRVPRKVRWTVAGRKARGKE